jgi:MFS family permease
VRAGAPPAAAGPSGLSERVAAGLEGRGGYPRWVLLVALAGMFATTFPVTVLTLAIPTIADDFGVAEAELSWLITLPVLCSALALPVLGKLGDLYGHRRIFIAGFAVALVTTALTATATTPVALIAWRTLTQVAGASTLPSSLALINSVHHGEARARAMGWWSMTAAGAPVVGLTIGAAVIDAVGWQMLFLVQSGLMVVPVVASWLILRETPRRSARFDLAGAALLAFGIGPLLLAVDQAPDWGLTAAPTLACLTVAVVMLAAFGRVERRVAAPLVPLTFFTSRPITSSLVASFLSSASYMGAFFLASLLVVKQFDYSLTSAVPILSIRPALFAVASPLGGRLTGRASTRTASLAGHLTLSAGLTGLAIGAATSSLLVVIVAGFLLQGIGFGLLRPAISTALADGVDESDLGVASAAERLTGQVGVAFGITVLATVYGSEIDRFPLAFAVGAAFAMAGAVASLGLRSGHPEHAPPPEALTEVV